jgi:hypothetical protein
MSEQGNTFDAAIGLTTPRGQFAAVESTPSGSAGRVEVFEAQWALGGMGLPERIWHAFAARAYARAYERGLAAAGVRENPVWWPRVVEGGRQ